MVHLEYLGIITAVLDFVLVVIIFPTLIKLIRTKRFNFQMNIILLAALFLLPVMTYESILYLDFKYNLLYIAIPAPLVKILFFVGVTGFIIYMLHFLTVEDFPIIPLSIIIMISGFALGSMISTVQLDLSNQQTPISYNPLLGGILFISTINLFSIISVVGFFISIWNYQAEKGQQPLTVGDTIAILCMTATPSVMFLVRIVHVEIPFNVIFLPTILGFLFHFGFYLVNASSSGYPCKTKLTDLIIVDTAAQHVLGGYTVDSTPDKNKLHGMVVLALDNLMGQMMNQDIEKTSLTEYVGSYGDILFIKKSHYVLIASFRGSGQNMGRFLFSRMLTRYIRVLENHKNENHINTKFTELVNYYKFVFTHKKNIGKEHFYNIGEN